MRKSIIRAAQAALAVVLVLLIGGGAAAEQWLCLPPMLTEIGAEAFLGDAALDAVYVPEGVRVIGPRAFANSGLTRISLPDSLESIADDAFDGTALAVISSPEGSYARTWAEEHPEYGYATQQREQLLLSVGCGRTFAIPGSEITWNARVIGSDPDLPSAFAFTFTLYKGGELLETVEVQVGEDDGGPDEAEPRDAALPSVPVMRIAAEAGFTRRLDAEDVYTVSVTARFGTDGQLETASRPLTIAWPPLILESVACDGGSVLLTQTRTWTADASGGIPPYEYAFDLEKDGARAGGRAFSARNTFQYTFFEAGDYTLRAQARDSRGVLAEAYELPVRVLDGSAAMTAKIRIYVKLDANGEIIVGDNSKTGHYELQIDNADAIVFDDRAYADPVFSYDKMTDGSGAVAMHDGATVLKKNVNLYTYAFATTVEKVGAFLKNALGFLDTDNEIEQEKQNKYQVTNGPFKQYDLATSNCFIATAKWCSALGYNALNEILAQSEAYTDYLAWQLYEKFGKDAWTYEGTY